MGLEYYLLCNDCGEKSVPVEFSVCKGYKVKNLPQDYETIEGNWVPFLVRHSGHKIALIDSKGNETDPAKITGGYVLGLLQYGK
ncbi:unnamed protein product [marine sediment metagenome]|uniref:Uncharacterized protein n=1 Tax=marine sediment metagenome TaxID=412755 RepID=X1NR31_9ZZZZ